MLARGMNLMMMLERGSGEITAIGDEIKKISKKEKQIGNHVTKIAGEFDSLRNTRRVEPIILKNKYEVLHEDEDEDNAEELNALTNQHYDNDNDTTQRPQWTKHKPNKRQRQRRKEICAMSCSGSRPCDCECLQQCDDTQKPQLVAFSLKPLPSKYFNHCHSLPLFPIW